MSLLFILWTESGFWLSLHQIFNLLLAAASNLTDGHLSGNDLTWLWEKVSPSIFLKMSTLPLNRTPYSIFLRFSICQRFRNRGVMGVWHDREKSISITAGKRKSPTFQKGEATELLPRGITRRAQQQPAIHQMPIPQFRYRELWFYVRNERQCCWFVCMA